jgi:hypothetical protein
LTASTSTVTWSTAAAIPLSKAGDNGITGANGLRTAFLEMYLWSVSKPTSFPSGTSTYTWSTGEFTAPATTNNWSLTPGAALPGQTLWGVSVAVSDTLTTLTSQVTWQYPKISQIAETGVTVTPGTRTAVLEMYRWSATQPTTFPNGSSTYTWSTQQFTAPATNNSWSLTPGSAVAGQRLWITRVVYTDSSSTSTTAITWNYAIAYPATANIAEIGVNTTVGTRTAVLEMYRWSATQPTTFPNGSSTYTWSTQQFTAPATTNSWTLTPGSAVAGQRLWITRVVYTDTSSSSSTNITWNATQAISTEIVGVSGQRIAVLEMYQWAVNSPNILPSGGSTYTWATGQFTAPATPNGWSLSPGSATFAGQKLWATSVAYIDSLTTLSTPINWGGELLAETEILGVSGQRAALLEVYIWSTSTPTVLPVGTSTYTWSTGAFTAPTTANGWSRAPGASTLGQKLWAVAVPYTDSLSTATTEVTWEYAIAYPVGVAGSSTLLLDLSNGSHIFPASTTGAVSSYVNSGTQIRVYEGDTELSYNGLGTTNGTWTVSAVGSNITPGSITDSGTFATVGQHSGVADATDTSAITYTITGKTTAGVNFTLTKAQTFTKSKTGATGAAIRIMYARIANNPVPVAGTVTVTGDNRPTGAQGSAVWGAAFNVTWSASDPTPSSNNSLYQADGIFNGTDTVWSAPYISSLKVGSLSAVNVNTGALTVQDSLTVSTTGNIKGGQTAYATGTGFFLGYSATTYKFSIGSSTTNMTWDGTALAVNGGTITGSTIQTSASTSVARVYLGTFGASSNVGLLTYTATNNPGIQLNATTGEFRSANYQGNSSVIAFSMSKTALQPAPLTIDAVNLLGGTAIRGSSTSGIGVLGESETGFGGTFEGNASKAPIFLEPLASLPTDRSYGAVCMFGGWLCFANGTHWFQSNGVQLT